MSTNPASNQSRYSLGYLFVATTVFSVGLSLGLNTGLPSSVRIAGAGICLYWIAKSVFALSTRLPAPAKEALFLLGLPLYLLCIVCVAWGGLESLFLLASNL